MTTIDELKKAIVYMEHIAHYFELNAERHYRMSSHFDDGEPEKLEFEQAAKRSEADAKRHRIAAACMWEKLERLEKEAAGC